MNKLLRTVKTRKKAMEILNKGNVTVFKKNTWGLRSDGTRSILLKNTDFQIFEGIFYNYQLPLKDTDTIELLSK